MNDNAKKWVAALRSGEFEQGAKYFAKDGKYCCLGVACMIYQREVGGLDIGFNKESGALIFDDLEKFIPHKVRAWIGLRSETGAYRFDKGFLEHTALTERNDRGTPFAEIADIIESEPEGLFND